MRTRFIDFEGIYGSGKSTCARELYESLSQEVPTEIYFEDDIDTTNENACDIRMTAVLSNEELEAIIRDYPFKETLIRGRVKVYNGWQCIFTPEFRNHYMLYQDLQRYVANNGRVTTRRFIEALLGKVKAFVSCALTTDKVYIFENIIFGQILDELIRTIACEEEQMIACIMEIVSLLEPLNPTLFYLCPDDLRRQIKKVAKERKSDDYSLYPDWMDWMLLSLQRSKYGEARNVRTKEDLMVYFKKYVEIEEKCLNQLQIENKHWVMIDQMDYNTENQYILERCREKKVYMIS